MAESVIDQGTSFRKRSTTNKLDETKIEPKVKPRTAHLACGSLVEIKIKIYMLLMSLNDTFFKN